MVVLMYEEMHPSRSMNPPGLYAFNKELDALIWLLIFLKGVVFGLTNGFQVLGMLAGQHLTPHVLAPATRRVEFQTNLNKVAKFK